jgi:putative FmdB family regulatory protein
MPTYVYRCEQGHTFEVFHGISDETPRPCPECGAAAKRVPSGGAGLLFKGSGFYITDYRSKGYKESAKKEGGASTDKPASGGSPTPSEGSGGSTSGTSSSPATPSGPGGSTSAPGGSTSAPGGPTSSKPAKPEKP